MIRQPTAAIVEVTPKMAQEWLDKTETNTRPTSTPTVVRYAELIEGGRWMLSCDAIGFDWNGNNVNGKHRLSAIVLTGVAIKALVVWGLDPDVFEVLDNGKKRSPGDVLAILGYKNYNMLAAAARYLFGYARTGRVHYSVTNTRVENDEMVAILKAHPGLSSSVEVVSKFGKEFGRWMSMSNLAFLHYVYSKDYPEEALAFIEKLASGVSLASDDPALVLRDRLMKEAMAQTSLPRGQAMALMIMCFNRHVQGRRMKIVRWSPENGQEYPQPDVESPPANIQVETDGAHPKMVAA